MKSASLTAVQEHPDCAPTVIEISLAFASIVCVFVVVEKPHTPSIGRCGSGVLGFELPQPLVHAARNAATTTDACGRPEVRRIMTCLDYRKSL